MQAGRAGPALTRPGMGAPSTVRFVLRAVRLSADQKEGQFQAVLCRLLGASTVGRLSVVDDSKATDSRRSCAEASDDDYSYRSGGCAC